MAHDFYRVGGFHALKGVVDAKGKITAWDNHFITFTADGKTPVSGGGIGPPPGRPGPKGPGEFPAPFIANYRLTQTMIPLADSVRAVARAGLERHRLSDPVFHQRAGGCRETRPRRVPAWIFSARRAGCRKAILTRSTRGAPRRVIKLAAEKSDWSKKLPKGSWAWARVPLQPCRAFRGSRRAVGRR